MPIGSMLGSADRNAIRGFFLRDQPLNSPSVKSLVDVLGKTPTLRSVQLHMMFSRNGKFHCFDHDDMFAKFTFSGAREALLVQELRKRVTACPRHQALSRGQDWSIVLIDLLGAWCTIKHKVFNVFGQIIVVKSGFFAVTCSVSLLCIRTTLNYVWIESASQHSR